MMNDGGLIGANKWPSAWRTRGWEGGNKMHPEQCTWNVKESCDTPVLMKNVTLKWPTHAVGPDQCQNGNCDPETEAYLSLALGDMLGIGLIFPWWKATKHWFCVLLVQMKLLFI